MRTVTGFHTCSLDYAKAVCAGDVPLEDWRLSRNRYDWLGDGIYFWEDGLRRAQQWAHEFVSGKAGIIQAEIDLGRCLDLGNTDHLELIRQTYFDLVETYRSKGLKLPTNREANRRNARTLRTLDAINRAVYSRMAGVEFSRRADNKLRFLDALVINEFVQRTEGVLDLQTIRYPFEEGEPVFPGAMIRSQSHVQLAVRDIKCIKGLSLFGM